MGYLCWWGGMGSGRMTVTGQKPKSNLLVCSLAKNPDDSMSLMSFWGCWLPVAYHTNFKQVMKNMGHLNMSRVSYKE